MISIPCEECCDRNTTRCPEMRGGEGISLLEQDAAEALTRKVGDRRKI